MSTFLKRLMIVTIAMLGGLALWPIIEINITYQSGFPSYFWSIVLQGLLIGGILGMSLGVSEGLLTRSAKKIKSGLIIGGATGAVGGIVGLFIGQGALLFLGQYFRLYGQPMIQTLGWVILGAFIGSAEGIRTRNSSRFLLGLLGGIIGGFLGGLFLEYTSNNLPEFAFSRLFGIIIFSGFIGLSYSLLESGATAAVLRVLNGPNKGKEFPLYARKSILGSSDKAVISLEAYDDLAEEHAVFIRKGKRIVISKLPGGHELKVNDHPISELELKWDDVIEAGTLKLLISAS